MQTQVANCNHTEVKGNILGSKSSIHDRNFWKFWRYFFHLIFAGSTFFQNTKSSSQIWIKKSHGKSFCLHDNCFKKIIFEKLFSNINFWQTADEIASNKKKKASKVKHESLDEVVKKHWESRSQILNRKDVLNIPQNSQKNVLANAETCSRGILENLKYCLEQSENIIMLFLSAAVLSLDNIYYCVVLTV